MPRKWFALQIHAYFCPYEHDLGAFFTFIWLLIWKRGRKQKRDGLTCNKGPNMKLKPGMCGDTRYAYSTNRPPGHPSNMLWGIWRVISGIFPYLHTSYALCKKTEDQKFVILFCGKNEEITWFFGFRQTDIFNFQHSPATGPLKTVSAAQELLFIIVKWKIREQLTGGFQWRKRDKSALLGALKM